MLKNTNAKVNWQASAKDRSRSSISTARRRSSAASPGQATDEDDSFLWNQGNFYPEERRPEPAARPVEARGQPRLRLEPLRERQVRVVRLGLRLRAARRRRQGRTASTSSTTRRYGSWFTYTARKPWHIIDVSGSSFKSPARRQPRVQVRLRLPPQPESLDHPVERLGGRRLHQRAGRQVRQGLSRPGRQLRRREHQRVLRRHLQQGPADLNVGVRWDKQTAFNEGSSAPANTMFPDLLPRCRLRRQLPDASTGTTSRRASA